MCAGRKMDIEDYYLNIVTFIYSSGISEIIIASYFNILYITTDFRLDDCPIVEYPFLSV